MIKIDKRYKPFSHIPGTSCLIPNSCWFVKSYPACIHLTDKVKEFNVFINIKGVVNNFTIQQDLEKNIVKIFGESLNGYFCFNIYHIGKTIFIKLHRGNDIVCSFLKKDILLKKKDCIEIPVKQNSLSSLETEKLFLGVSKKLDWDLVKRRNSLSEIFPIMFLLGQKINIQEYEKFDCLENEKQFTEFVLAGFDDILVPQKYDKKYLGIDDSQMFLNSDPNTLLRQGYKSIRKLFIDEDENRINIFPNLFKEFHSGKMISVKLKNCFIDLEWSKRKIRRINIKSINNDKIFLSLPKEINSFRFKKNPKDRGIIFNSGDPIIIESNKRYFLDKFQK